MGVSRVSHKLRFRSKVLLANSDQTCCNICLAAARNGQAKAEGLIAASFQGHACFQHTNTCQLKLAV